MKLTVVGTGYVGLVTGTCLSDMGHHVICHDVDAEKIRRLNEEHKIPIYEPGLEELVIRNMKADRLQFTTDFEVATAEAEVIFIAVGTPPQEDGSADLKHVLAVAESIGNALRPSQHMTVVVKSTVPVGTCDKVRALINEVLEKRGTDASFDVVSNPEFLKEGMAVDDFMRPDRIVVGVGSERASEVMQKIYIDFTRNGHPLLMMDVRSSEMTKYASNVMLAARISLVNEFAAICEKVGADILSVRKGMGTDSRIGMSFLYAGVGYGGSCFPKDVKALAQLARDMETPATILDAVEEVNGRQKLVLAEKIKAHFGGDLSGKRIALWGIAFKPRTDDIREAPAVSIAEALREAGAEVVAFDPEAMSNAKSFHPGLMELTEDMYAAAEGADALALVTEWGEFRNPDFQQLKNQMKGPVIFDGRNQYDPAELRRLGFTYYAIGRPRA
ncbi:MAG: UDP-glucose/GDP-mannose dehydrogenase family protein [Myxococcota bacterium]